MHLPRLRRLFRAAARRSPSVPVAATAARVSGTAVKAQCEAEPIRRVAVAGEDAGVGRVMGRRSVEAQCEAGVLP
ncbi:hypothetical protein E2C01_090014 [Portunus trituberculatus]|uniref:Uncharacterized protein n=1 Tax=Portunus trituberculatus TaxID=210409 RepID=A0A5B7JP10_PORTR|nr:hypothetical protein [Portunus trituberculatus]